MVGSNWWIGELVLEVPIFQLLGVHGKERNGWEYICNDCFEQESDRLI